MAHDVFISYAHEDKTIADAVCAKLEGNGVRCWIAPRDTPPGLPYAKAITDAIAASAALVLVFTARSNQSKHVKREVDRALHHGLPILPFRIEDVAATAEMEYYLAGQHWLDAITPRWRSISTSLRIQSPSSCKSHRHLHRRPHRHHLRPGDFGRQ